MKERGHAAVELAMAIAVLLLPVILVVTAFGPWSEREVFAEAAAAEAARRAAVSLRQDVGDQAVVSMAEGHGLPPEQLRVGWCGADPTPVTSTAGACPFVRGSLVVVEVEVWTPLLQTPWGPVGGLWITGSHAEHVDTYRSLG